jgi:AcrR family transcriptional regulator
MSDLIGGISMHYDKQEVHQSQRILNAAFDHISKKGYANVSLREIADEAGVVLSQLNYYYKNKEGLLVEVIRMTMKKYMNEVKGILIIGSTAKEKLNNLICYFQGTLRKNQNLFRLLFDLTSMAMWSESFGNLLNELFDDLAQLIEDNILNIATPEFKLSGYTTHTTARMIFGALFGTSIQVLLNPDEKELPEALSVIGSML